MGQVDNLAFIISKAGYSSVRANPKTGFGTPKVTNLQSQEFGQHFKDLDLILKRNSPQESKNLSYPVLMFFIIILLKYE